MLGDDGVYCPDLIYQLRVLLGSKRLGAVAESFFGTGVDLDDQAIGTDGDTRAGERIDHIITACSVGRVDYYRQMADALDGRDDRKI